MEITIIGYILIPFGIFLLFTKSSTILFFLLFFSGFTATGVVNFLNIGYTLTAPFYIAIIMMIRYIIVAIKRMTIAKPNIILTVFIIICFFSLLMPFILSGQNIIVNTQDNELMELSFSSQNITQFIYILFCFIVYWITKDIVKRSSDKLEIYVNIYFLGAFVISLIGYYQLIAYYLNLPFDEIFRDSLLGWAQGTRVYAVAIEPSMLAFYVMPTLALLIFYEGKMIINKKILIIMLVVLGALSTSSTFLLGLFIFILLLLYRNLLKSKFKKYNINIIKKGFFYSIISVMLLVFLWSSNQSIANLFEYMIDSTLGKVTLKNMSGHDRFMFATMMFDIFVKSPILGVGFGSTRSTDLITTWLANIGLLGVSVFIAYILKLYLNLSKLVRFESKSLKLCESYIYFFVLVIVSAFVSVSEPYFLFIWVNFGVCEVYLWKITHTHQSDS